MFWTPHTVADMFHLCCYCYANLLLAVERKEGHLELWGLALRSRTEEGSITTFQACCLLQESWKKNGEKEENIPCPPTAFGVNGDDCCKMICIVSSS